MVTLTIHNDPDLLQKILQMGKSRGWTPNTAVGYKMEMQDPKAIHIACQQNFKRCMAYLFEHGYRRKDDDKEGMEEDQVKKFLAFKRKSNIYYLCLEFTEQESTSVINIMDPFRKVQELMSEADENMEDFQGSSEMKRNYLDIKQELEAFMVAILNQCQDMDEVKTILEHNPKDNLDDELDESENNWQLALHKESKHLVSHPNFQQFLWRKMIGDGSVVTQIPLSSLADKIPEIGPMTNVRIKRLFWNLKEVPLTLLTFLFCYPFVVFADFCRKGDILFVSPSTRIGRNMEIENNDASGGSSGLFCYFSMRIHTPLLRMIPYFFIQIVYLIIIGLSIFLTPNLVTVNFTEHWHEIGVLGIGFFMTASFFIDDIINLFRPRHLQSVWTFLSLISHLLMISGAVIAIFSTDYRKHELDSILLANLSGNDGISVGMTLIAYGSGMRFFLILSWLILLETTGPIVLCVLTVIRDALRMVSIYFVIFLAHAIAFWSLYKPFRENPSQAERAGEQSEELQRNYTLVESSLKTQRGLLSSLFWAIVVSEGPDVVNIKNINNDEKEFSLEFSHLMGLVLWGVYQIMIYVLMLNILIAVMNTSYSNLWQNVQVEWKFNKSHFQVKLKY